MTRQKPLLPACIRFSMSHVVRTHLHGCLSAHSRECREVIGRLKGYYPPVPQNAAADAKKNSNDLVVNTYKQHNSAVSLKRKSVFRNGGWVNGKPPLLTKCWWVCKQTKKILVPVPVSGFWDCHIVRPISKRKIFPLVVSSFLFVCLLFNGNYYFTCVQLYTFIVSLVRKYVLFSCVWSLLHIRNRITPTGTYFVKREREADDV